MNKPTHDADWLERALNLDDDYIDDNGFTERVMQQLPSSHQHIWLEPVLLTGAALLSSLFALMLLPGAVTLYNQFLEFITAQSLLVLFGGSMLAAFMLSGIAWLVGSSED